jgi:hypothetical protein
MSLSPPSRYALDPEDPRAPSEEQWAALTPAERRAVVNQLPSEFPRLTLPEGDPHWTAKAGAIQTLRGYFDRIGRRVYLAAELPVYYPAERMFAPDLIAVVDAELLPRMSWVVSAEGRGVDLALEIHVAGDSRKDFVDNVTRFARLGIPEYFAFDVGRSRLLGWRLPQTQARAYVPIVPQAGRWASQVLGLELALEGGRLRFFHGSAAVLDAQELLQRLTVMVDELTERAESEGARAESAASRAALEAERARLEAERAERLAARLRALGVDPDEV